MEGWPQKREREMSHKRKKRTPAILERGSVCVFQKRMSMSAHARVCVPSGSLCGRRVRPIGVCAGLKAGPPGARDVRGAGCVVGCAKKNKVLKKKTTKRLSTPHSKELDAQVVRGRAREQPSVRVCGGEKENWRVRNEETP
jgi:hypothetical protein